MKNFKDFKELYIPSISSQMVKEIQNKFSDTSTQPTQAELIDLLLNVSVRYPTLLLEHYHNWICSSGNSE